MYRTLKISAITLLAASTLLACSGKSDETEIAVTDVPAKIIAIVQNTLPGISLNKAEKKIKDGRFIYELEGKLINGKEYEIKIAEDGSIIKIELED